MMPWFLDVYGNAEIGFDMIIVMMINVNMIVSSINSYVQGVLENRK